MDFILEPWQLYFLILAGWVNRQQQMVIDYLRIENQVLKEKLGKRRILLNDNQRRRLAVKARFWDTNCSKRWVRCSRPTPFSAGIDNSSPRSGITLNDGLRESDAPACGK